MGDFKKLRVWQDGIRLTKSIYTITKQASFSKDFGLSNQIQRASVSIPSNISEGDERGTDKESIHFFNIAKGSTAEVITQLIIAEQAGYITQSEREELEDLAEKIRSSLKKLIAARKRSQL